MTTRVTLFCLCCVSKKKEASALGMPTCLNLGIKTGYKEMHTYAQVQIASRQLWLLPMPTHCFCQSPSLCQNFAFFFCLVLDQAYKKVITSMTWERQQATTTPSLLLLAILYLGLFQLVSALRCATCLCLRT
jgi:hypothetical protein